MRFPALTALFAGCALAQTPDIHEIMARVAESQARSLAARRNYVYDQDELLRMNRGGGKLAREEKLRYTVLPAEHGVRKTLIECEGKYQTGGKVFAFSEPSYHYKNLDLDAAIMAGMEGSTGEEKSLDGISRDYFPLTAAEQAQYNFYLEGTETVRGRMAYRVRFEPRRRQHIHADTEDTADDDDGVPWKGVALIDAEEYQPIRVTTDLAWKIPRAVKILLGTNITGLGFAISYDRMADGVWFPVSFGGEFEVRGLFLYKRTISVSLANKNFRRVDIHSTLEYTPAE